MNAMNLPVWTADAVVLLVITLASVVFGITARRRWQTSAAVVTTGAVTYWYGLLATVFSTLHLIAVAARPLFGRGLNNTALFTYDFQFYSMMLMGVVLLMIGTACLRTAAGVAQGKFLVRQRALGFTVMLLMISGPLIPLHALGAILSLGALVNILVLTASRERFVYRKRTGAATAAAATPQRATLTVGTAGAGS